MPHWFLWGICSKAMKKEDVPQQGGLAAGCREVNYAVDDAGHYTLASSAGWDVKNVTLRQAWETIVERLELELQQIKAGRRSALSYHMIKYQMDISLLSQYTGISRWRVRRHLQPKVFQRLGENYLLRYAELFGISVDALQTVPDVPDLTLEQFEDRDS